MTKAKTVAAGVPTEIHLWSARPNSMNPWMLLLLPTEAGMRYRAVYWSVKRREFMVSQTTYVSVEAFKLSRSADQKISSAGVPLRQAIIEGWMPDILSGA